MTLVLDPFVGRLNAITALTSDQADLARRMQGRTRLLPPRATIEAENDPVGSAYAIREGWVFAYKMLPSGDRQVTDFLVPGDMVGFGTLFQKVAEQSYETITDTELVEISAGAARQASRQSPELTEAFFALLSRERAKLLEHLIDVGRRDSVARVAHLLLELGRRLQLAGHDTRNGYACPLSQYLLADALGLTAIHVNRVLRKLRLSGLLTFRHGHVTFHDRDRLVELTGFDPAYVDPKPTVVALFASMRPGGAPDAPRNAANGHRR
jgi:CRP-like cAMP-binding protein